MPPRLHILIALVLLPWINVSIPQATLAFSNMGGYGDGDAAWNQTSINTIDRLGGDDGPFAMTPAQIVLIVATIAVFLLALFLVFYFRTLKMRRKIDMANKHRETTSANASAGAALRGDAIELQSEFSLAMNAACLGSGCGDADKVASPGALESGRERKPRLWHYVRWRDPYDTPMPRIKPCRVVEDTRIVAPYFR
ncbi:hypothetical protein B0T22DRAFT_438470 [Podospora appendiculata]|uniref:Uncharacterized protein n=1 Tax=Podospora appendiculata TaxID=314037 RepID=A0AAE0XLQ4_9PEZI|nr:hypothetical protein B0T22DRAFT_438470 [Podospora appendiculata]